MKTLHTVGEVDLDCDGGKCDICHAEMFVLAVEEGTDFGYRTIVSICAECLRNIASRIDEASTLTTEDESEVRDD